GENWGVVVNSNVASSLEGIVIRNTRIKDVICGIQASGNTQRNHYFCNNIIEGQLTNLDTGIKTWGINGIEISGQGITVCSNSLSGFGDTIDIPDRGVNRAIDIFANDILWGGDDGLELDGGERNIRAYGNRISNSGTGISVQPGNGGPFYIYRNIIYNPGQEFSDQGILYEAYLPFKFKNGASGMYVFHNTAVRPGNAWQQGETLSNSKVYNNLILGTTGGVSFGISSDTQVDYNGFNRNTPFGNNGVRLTQAIFDPLDAILASGSTDWTPYYTPGVLELNANSSAVNSGKILPNINDDYLGSAPDLGAIELGQTQPNYGITLSDPTGPSMVTGLNASGVSDTVMELTWSVAIDPESGVSAYNVYRNGSQIASISATIYQDTNLTENTRYTYEIAAVNGAGNEGSRSTVISASTLADTIAPTIVSVKVGGNPNLVSVTFSEIVSLATAQNLSNYSIINGISISAAVLDRDRLTVQLTTSTLIEGTNYRLNVSNIADRASTPNEISTGQGKDFIYVDRLIIDQIQPSGYRTGILVDGATVYWDRNYTYTNIPASYSELNYLLTANNDKLKNGGGSISFRVNKPVTIHVGYDTRNILPTWLLGWMDTAYVLTSDDTALLRLYSKTFEAGTVSLGGNEKDNSMYVVVVQSDISTPSGNTGTGGSSGVGVGSGSGSGSGANPDPGTDQNNPGNFDANSTGTFSLLELAFLMLLIFAMQIFRRIFHPGRSLFANLYGQQGSRKI
ncbi:MAG: fibronectin type III domain-containing protein, partial [Thiohalomonadales bacterium]